MEQITREEMIELLGGYLLTLNMQSAPAEEIARVEQAIAALQAAEPIGYISDLGIKRLQERRSREQFNICNSPSETCSHPVFLHPCPPAKAHVPEGYRAVPTTPTPDMTMQGALAGVSHANGEFSQKGAEAVYKAMLTASPAPGHSGDELVRDAERYRWLRNRRHSDIEVIGPHGDEDEQFLYEEELDEAIDAQRQQEETER